MRLPTPINVCGVEQAAQTKRHVGSDRNETSGLSTLKLGSLSGGRKAQLTVGPSVDPDGKGGHL